MSEDTNSLDDADSFKKRDVRNWTEQASRNVSNPVITLTLLTKFEML